MTTKLSKHSLVQSPQGELMTTYKADDPQPSKCAHAQARGRQPSHNMKLMTVA